MKTPDLQLERAAIDLIDGALIRALIDRRKVSRCTQQTKAKAGLPARDPDREADIILRYENAARGAGSVVRAILDWCRHES